MIEVPINKLEPILRRELKEPERIAVQEAVARAVESNPEIFIERFKALPQSFGGRFISSDTFKETFDQYRESNTSRNLYNAATHNSAAVLASEQLRRILAEPAEPGKKEVILLTGIPGAGKTSSVLEKGTLPRHTHAIYEGQLAHPEVAVAKSRQILDAGMRPVIFAVHTVPEKALDNTLLRFNEIGRGASIFVMATIQGGLPSGLAAVRDRFGDAVELVIVDRRIFSEPKVLKGWENLHVLQSEGNLEQIKQRLGQHLEQQRDRIAENAYRQASGLAPIDQDRRIDRGLSGQHEATIDGREAATGNRQTTALNQSSGTKQDQAREPRKVTKQPQQQRGMDLGM